MKFMIMFGADSATEERAPACKELDEMKEFMGELSRAGIVVSTEALKPSASGARVRNSGGRMSIKDGPFTEAKEMVAGFVIVRVDSRDEAVELSQRFLRIAGDGSSAEVREVIEAPTEAEAGVLELQL